MQLEEFLEESADHFPDKAALVCGERRLTYATLAEQSARLAGALLSAGLERGERVVICLDNSVETVVSIFAILQAGGVFVPLNPTTKADKVADSRKAEKAARDLDGKKVEDQAD